jgi:hypothetical protein
MRITQSDVNRIRKRFDFITRYFSKKYRLERTFVSTSTIHLLDENIDCKRMSLPKEMSYKHNVVTERKKKLLQTDAINAKKNYLVRLTSSDGL